MIVNLRPFLYMAAGAAAVAAVVYGPQQIRPVIQKLSHRYRLGQPRDPDKPMRATYTRNQAAFADLARGIEQCRGVGLISLYPDGHVLATARDTLSCAAAPDIARHLTRLGVDWINIDGQQPGQYRATFVLTPTADAGRASRSAITYNPGGAAPRSGGESLDHEGYWLFERGR